MLSEVLKDQSYKQTGPETKLPVFIRKIEPLLHMETNV